MKNKIVGILLICTLVLSISACGGETDTTSNQSVVTQNEVVDEVKDNGVENTANEETIKSDSKNIAGETVVTEEDNQEKVEEVVTTSSAVEIELRGNTRLKFQGGYVDVIENLGYQKSICDRTKQDPSFYASHVPENATGVVIEFEMKDCNLEFDEMCLGADFDTEVKSYSMAGTGMTIPYEGNGTYRASFMFSDYAANETLKKLKALNLYWTKENNTLRGVDITGEFNLTKVYYYTSEDIRDVAVGKLDANAAPIDAIHESELDDGIENYETECLDLTNTTILNIGEYMGYTLEMPVFTFAYSEKSAYNTRFMAHNSENNMREVYELFRLDFGLNGKNLDGEKAYKKLEEVYNEWIADGMERGYMESVELIGDASSKYILAYSVGRIQENGTDLEVSDYYQIYDSQAAVIYEVTLSITKDSALYGRKVMNNSVATYREELRNAMITLTNN